MAESDNELVLGEVPTVEVGMGLRCPRSDAFQALVDPDITTKFWFTESSGPVEAGNKLEWTWEMYGVSAQVVVKEVEENERIVINWGDPEKPTTVAFDFHPWGDDRTYLQITETGLGGDGADKVVAQAIDSTGGFTMLLSAMKAYLEHDVVLRVVLDRMPQDFDAELLSD